MQTAGINRHPNCQFSVAGSLTGAAGRMLAAAAVVLGLCLILGAPAQAKTSFELLAYLDQAAQTPVVRLIAVRARAERGNMDAQHQLGALLATGRGTDQDYAEAAQWLQRAAVQGHDDAQFWLGNLYMRGAGLPRDYDNMVKWWNRAAKNGNVSAQYALAAAYRSGAMMPRDLELSRTWFFMASGKSGEAEMYPKRGGTKKRRMTAKQYAQMLRDEKSQLRDEKLKARFEREFTGEAGQGGR
jgi:TPR repeat protein